MIFKDKYDTIVNKLKKRAEEETSCEIYLNGSYTDDMGILTDIIALLDKKGEVLETYALKSKHGIAYDLIIDKEDMKRRPNYDIY